MRRLLQEISEDLCKAIGESPAVSDKLTELKGAGYSLNLLLDCRLTDDSLEEEVLEEDQAESSAVLKEPKGQAAPLPDFRINANDLAFLKSVGIDPTRPGRSNRTSNPGGQLSTQGQVDG